MNRRLFLAMTTAVILASGLLAPGVAMAQDVVTTDQDGVVAVDHSPARPRGPQARPSIPGGIVVTGHGGYPVSVSAPGEPTLRVSRPGDAPARFTGLTPGTAYRVAVNERPIGTVTALSRPRPATRLVVRTTTAPDSVALTWRHSSTRATGGRGVDYLVAAVPATGATVRMVVHGRTSVTLSGLDPAALYRFSVTPRNAAGSGRPTAATMTRTLAQIHGTDAVIPARPESAPVTVPPAAPPAQPVDPPKAVEPARPAPPATRTIYVCPAGYTDNGGLCQKTTPYTYTSIPYTFHDEPIYGYGQVGWDYTWGYCTGTGKSGNWPNGDPYCQIPVYGNNAVVGTQQVKDATPSGYTDTGTAWRIKDSVPAGYLDDGQQWVMTVPKEAREVPA